MAVQLFANNASTTLSGSILSGDLTMTLADASAFPSPIANQYFLITIEVGASREIIKITSRTGNVLTVDPAGRGQEGTSPAPWTSGALVEGRSTKGTLQRMARYEDLLFNYASTVYDPAISAFASKSIIFASSDGKLRQDNANLSYDTATTALSATILKSLTLDSGAALGINFKTNSGTTQLSLSHVASAVNNVNFRGAIASSGPLIEAVGTDTNIDISVASKGSGLFKITTPFGYTGTITPTQITATQNDYSPTSASTANVIRISSDALRTITGFTGGVAGRVVTFINVGSFGINFTSEDINSTAANRFTLNTATVSIPVAGAISFWYDNTTSRWRGLASPSGSASATETVQTVTDQATIAWDTSLGAWGVLTLAGNRNVAAPTNMVDGKEYVLFVIQDATGNRTLTWNIAFKWSLAVTPILSTAAASIDLFSFKSRSGNLYGGFLKGMA